MFVQQLYVWLKPQSLIASSMFLEDMHPSEHLVEDSATFAEDENLNNGAEVYDPMDNKEEGLVIDEEVAAPPNDLSENDIVTIHDPISAVQDDARKTSYASIVSLSLYIFLHCVTLLVFYINLLRVSLI